MAPSQAAQPAPCLLDDENHLCLPAGSGAPSPGDSSSILPFGVADSPAYNGPAMTRPPTPAFAPAGTQLAQCGTIPSTCVSANTADAPLAVNLNLTCNPNQTITVRACLKQHAWTAAQRLSQRCGTGCCALECRICLGCTRVGIRPGCPP